MFRVPFAGAEEGDGADLMGAVSAFIANGAKAELPREVVETAKLHILDTLAAMVSGSQLIPGKRAMRYVRSQGGKAEARGAASSLMTSAVNAAFANGMMAHADETDDSHRATLVHPGAAIVRAARWRLRRCGRPTRMPGSTLR